MGNNTERTSESTGSCCSHQMVVPVADSDPSDCLAAERTYLAWMRTALAVMAIGFGAAKLSEDNRHAIILTIFALASAGVMGAFGTFRYYEVVHGLDQDTFRPDKIGPLMVSC